MVFSDDAGNLVQLQNHFIARDRVYSDSTVNLRIVIIVWLVCVCVCVYRKMDVLVESCLLYAKSVD